MLVFVVLVSPGLPQVYGLSYVVCLPAWHTSGPELVGALLAAGPTSSAVLQSARTADVTH
jgi:hypothetical protein